MTEKKDVRNNVKFIRHLMMMAVEMRKREKYANSHDYYRGYYWTLDRIVQWYAAMINATREQVIVFIEVERGKAEKKREDELNKRMKFRENGAIQAFNDVLDAIARREAIP